MFIKIMGFIITNEDVVPKKNGTIDEEELKREFKSRLDRSLRKNCAYEVLENALRAIKKE